MRWRGAFWIAGLSLAKGTAAAVLDIRHGSHEHAEPETHAQALPHMHDASQPMPDVPKFCTVPSYVNTSTDCIALDTVDWIIPVHDAGATLRPAPRRNASHGHTHGGGAPPMLALNETLLFSKKGPVPLSYIEWDYGLGAGELKELRRFASLQADQIAATWPDRIVIGVAHGYWRSLADQDDPKSWTALREDVRSRIGGDMGDTEPVRHRALWVVAAFEYIFACFVLLPVLLCVQAVQSSLSPLLAAAYLATLTLALITGRLYFALSPSLYPPNAFGGMVRAVYVLSVGCFASEIVLLVGRVARIVRGVPKYAGSMHGMHAALRLLLNGSEDLASAPPSSPPMHSRPVPRSRGTSSTDQTLGDSVSSDAAPGEHKPYTVFDSDDAEAQLLSSPVASDFPSLDEAPPVSYWDRLHTRHPRVLGAGSLLYTVVSRGLVPLAFATVYVGVAIYTGSCRKNYKNPCLAHGIKGGIFFWYGILSFARYLGAFGEYGWAWNKRPTLGNSQHSSAARWRRTMPTAEFVECFVVFLYGASNTWLERLGSKSTDPYTVKQVQHISIAVMFWFVGLVGMGIESKALRSLIGSAVVHGHPSSTPAADAEGAVEAQTPPPSYASYFNPFPALVIGVTGVAMAAHHQDYVYEVQVHMLWGVMLAAFALFRMLTYFLLWLRPPSSILPGRPPTEIIASFALTCGGLLFILSNEEVSFAAMRANFGDFMAMLNVAIAAVALVFSWSFAIMVVKAWALRREHRLRPWLRAGPAV